MMGGSKPKISLRFVSSGGRERLETLEHPLADGWDVPLVVPENGEVFFAGEEAKAEVQPIVDQLAEEGVLVASGRKVVRPGLKGDFATASVQSGVLDTQLAEHDLVLYVKDAERRFNSETGDVTYTGGRVVAISKYAIDRASWRIREAVQNNLAFASAWVDVQVERGDLTVSGPEDRWDKIVEAAVRFSSAALPQGVFPGEAEDWLPDNVLIDLLPDNMSYLYLILLELKKHWEELETSPLVAGSGVSSLDVRLPHVDRHFRLNDYYLNLTVGVNGQGNVLMSNRDRGIHMQGEETAVSLLSGFLERLYSRVSEHAARVSVVPGADGPSGAG
jgi:hypothetical protein